MTTAVTRELLENLQKEGYTFLVAENQASFDWYTFIPVKWDEEYFMNETIKYSFDDHMILSISEALRSLRFEDYLNHEVILP